ncbi:LuxR C-terminal-related transcriptional regulator [Streptomyces sp. NPDC047123]|uniref:LuxR C-terminal-related transcriptional regulator n=1 Tax=Streptomyces sp. NPDC047123 TaxID=3155622 RepID=UPI0033DEDE42
MRNVNWTPREAAKKLSWSQQEIKDSISYLHQLGLLTRSEHTPSGWTALPPQSAMSDMLTDAKSKLDDFCAEVFQTWERSVDVLTEFKSTYMRHLESQHATVLHSSADITATLEREIRGATHEVLLLGSGRIHAAPLRDALHSVLQRNVHLRCVIRSSTVGLPEASTVLGELLNCGVEARAYPTLPLSFALIDRSTALFSLPTHEHAEDEQDRQDQMVVMKSPLSAGLLQSMFDFYWSQSTALALPDTKETAGKALRPVVLHSTAAPTPVNDTQQATLLRMLAGGMTDQAISRRLGLHERTVRRKVAEIASNLQASSRFQAGVNAALTGLLDDSDPDLSAQSAPAS